MKYLALSDNGGILTSANEESTYTLIHNGNEVEAQPTPKGGRPTIMNKEFALKFISEHSQRGSFHLPEINPDKIEKATSKPSYKYNFPNQDSFSPEYQLYLAHELEREIIRKGSKVKGDANTIRELSGLLPHEEEQDEH